MTLEEKKAARFKFLNHLYEVVDGNRYEHCDMFEVGQEVGFDKELTENVVDYLQDEGLLEMNASGGIIGITHQGIREVERSLSEPNKPTRYFPPAMNVITIHHMENSSIQQASPGAHQAIKIDDSSTKHLHSILDEIKRAAPQLGLAEDQRADLDAEVATVEAQLKSSKPKPGVVNLCLASIGKIFEGAAGNLVASGIGAQIAAYLQSSPNP